MASSEFRNKERFSRRPESVYVQIACSPAALMDGIASARRFDCFDALISNRPYKKAFTADKELRIMAQDEAGQFAPGILQVLLDNKPEFVEIMRRLSD